jgi:DNA repair ATPase RecN
MTPDFEARYESVMDQARKVETSYAMLQERQTELTGQIEHLNQEDVLLEKVGELFKHLLNKYVYEYAESFSRIVTEGLQSIYFDQDVKFDIEVEQKRGKVYANFVTEQNGVRANPLESFGGGVASVVSLLLRILVLLKADLARYLVLDEALGALSTEYVETCGDFLRKLCDELDVNILLVTHNADFVDQSDNAYMGSSDANERLQLKKIR